MKPLFQPVKPFIINQRFGENNACVDIATGRIVITADGNNPPPGYKSLYGPGGHTATDLATTHGQPVYCAIPGTVYAIDTEPRSGLDVRVESIVGGKKYRTIYEHLLGYQVKKGQFAPLGSLIGWADNTGYSSGDHLHFVLQEEINGKWVNIDPLPLMNNTFALDAVPVLKKLKELMAQLMDLMTDRLRK